MSYKTILLHLDDGERSLERCNLAFDLAEKFNAHLVGLYATLPVVLPEMVVAAGGPVLTAIAERNHQAAKSSAEAAFRIAATRRLAVNSEWRSVDGDPVTAIALNARYADLIVAGQPDRHAPDNDGMPPQFAADLVEQAGRPVLFVPYAGSFPDTGRRVLVAWNAGRESARALSDALPLLERASAVTVMVFDAGHLGSLHGDVPGADMGLFLARHGIKVTVSQQAGHDVDIGAQILSRAADLGSDLIVMGAFGHSRVREKIFGGVTRTILDAMTVPVLMSR